MPSPIIHFTVANIVSLSAKNELKYVDINLRSFLKNYFYHSFSNEGRVFVVISLLPDLDILPGMIFHDPYLFHHGFSHSFVFAISTAAIGSLILKQIKLFPYLLMVSFSHPILDLLNIDQFNLCTQENCKLMLLWPNTKFRVAIFNVYFNSIYLTLPNKTVLFMSNFKVIIHDILFSILVTLVILKKKWWR